MERIKLIVSRCAATGQTKELFPGLIKKRGHIAGPEVQALLDAGFSRQEVLEVILGLALKTLSSTTNNLAGTPLDDAFAAEKQDLRKVGWGACQPTTWRAPSFAASFT
jgi:hypothetical protein